MPFLLCAGHNSADGRREGKTILRTSPSLVSPEQLAVTAVKDITSEELFHLCGEQPAHLQANSQLPTAQV